MSIPVVSPVAGSGAMINSRYTRLYNNPHFDYLSYMLPQDIKELFKWCEIVFQSMPIVANGIRKLINYPVTDFTCSSDSEEIRRQTKELLTTIGIKSVLLEFGTDYYVYGNVFRSVYLPFRRMLRCTRCGDETAIDHSDFKVQKKDVLVKCPNCRSYVRAELHDIPTHNIEDVKIVRWDPKQIELSQNPITGEVSYYYELPKKFVQEVLRGELTVFSDTPKIFIDAALAKRNVKMGSNFYHAKTSGLAGFSSGWGIPPLMATLKNYMYIAVLRRAAESIGMEHITPQRILYPQSTGTSDPCVMSSMDRWQKEITSALERWRMDPNYVMTAPYPTGIVNIGSQGRQLTPTEEIKDARMDMALALDIPPGLIMGDSNFQSSAVALRILENQLTPYMEKLNGFANWLVRSINAHTERDYCDISLVPFKLADDMMNKQVLMGAIGQLVSKATVQEAFNIDPDKERDRLKDEQITEQLMQMEIEREMQKRQQNAAQQAEDQEMEAQTGQPSQFNQQKMLAQAQELAMQMLSAPYEERRSMLAQLQNEDYIMWAVVSKQIEAMRAQQGGGEGGME